MNRNAKIAIVDDSGREREKYPVVYGAKIKVKDGDRVEVGQKLVEWDPYSLTILTETGGKVAYGDILEGVTMKEEFDEVTGLSRKVIIEQSGATLRPRVSIKDDSGKTAKVSGCWRSAGCPVPVAGRRAHFCREGCDGASRRRAGQDSA
jgi:DNA-directed RNA polymerase subunit beta'